MSCCSSLDRHGSGVHLLMVGIHVISKKKRDKTYFRGRSVEQEHEGGKAANEHARIISSREKNGPDPAYPRPTHHLKRGMWRFGLGNKGDEPPPDGQSVATTASGTTATSAAAGHPSSSQQGGFAGGGSAGQAPPQDRTPPPAHLNRQGSSSRSNNNSGRQQ